MGVRFNDTQPASAAARTLSEVITDYGNYPSFNPSVGHAGPGRARRPSRGVTARPAPRSRSGATRSPR